MTTDNNRIDSLISEKENQIFSSIKDSNLELIIKNSINKTTDTPNQNIKKKNASSSFGDNFFNEIWPFSKVNYYKLLKKRFKNKVSNF